MTETAVKVLGDFFENDFWFSEVLYGGVYRTDLVAVDVDFQAVEERVNATGCTEPLTSKWRRLITYEGLRSKEPASIDEMVESRNYPYASSYCRTIYNWLRKNGYLRKNEDGLFEPVPFPDVINQVIAFELKQKDWEKALKQASRANYADSRYVVMDADHVEKPADNLDKFREEGVGLISLERENMKVILEAGDFETGYLKCHKARWKLREDSFDKSVQEKDIEPSKPQNSISDFVERGGAE
ncbi:hypothetical protein OB919_15995 [Halobacteria archaeon AArc-curdl1]|uniref:Uncharacterized protein n=1 Tax=Natronosalvus hydrolyticus TaxID=2979988 RepID=A0AAP2ZA23_9EURY|nr:hypothetical protein [Halobacteria archaeon AArc-curdl1]